MQTFYLFTLRSFAYFRACRPERQRRVSTIASETLRSAQGITALRKVSYLFLFTRYWPAPLIIRCMVYQAAFAGESITIFKDPHADHSKEDT